MKTTGTLFLTAFLIVLFFTVTVTIYPFSSSSDTSVLKDWDIIMVEKTSYDESNSFAGSFTVYLKDDTEDKTLYCRIRNYNGRDAYQLEEAFEEKYYDRFISLLEKAAIKKKTNEDDLSVTITEKNLTMSMYLMRDDNEYYNFEWYKGTFYSEYKFIDETVMNKLTALASELGEIVNAKYSASLKTYDLEWKSIVLDERQIVFGELKWAKTAKLRINHKDSTITFSYSYFNGNKTTVDVSKTFDSSYYEKLMKINDGVTIRDRKKDPEDDMFAWDAGTLKTISYFTGGTRQYYIYLDEDNLKSDFVFSGNYKALLDFIRELSEETKIKTKDFISK